MKMDKEILVILAIVGLVVVNVMAFAYLGIFGLFVTAGCWPVIERLLIIVEKAK